jgi:uncharacterized protein (DUF3820 family)
MDKLTAKSLFPFGAYKDRPCGEINDRYLQWLAGRKDLWADRPLVAQYLRDRGFLKGEA